MVPRKATATTKKTTKTAAPVKKAAPVYQDVPKNQDSKPAQKTRFAANVGRVGNVGSVEELQYSAKGSAWLRFSMGYQPYNAETKEKGETVWYRCVCFGFLAENCANTLNVGMRVVVSGRPELNEWTDEEGQKHQQKQIICDGVGPDLAFAVAEVSKVSRRVVTQGEMFEEEEEPF